MSRRRGSWSGAALGALDLLLAALTLGGAVLRILPAGRRRAKHAPPGRVLMIFNTFYSLSVLRSRGAEYTITHRDLDGYFDHVWSVHPLVGADPEEFEHAPTGRPAVTALTDRHTVIEGGVRRSPRLERLPMLNFALAQAQMLRMLSRLAAREQVGMIRAWEPFYTGLMALGLGRLHGIPVEIRIAGNYDDIYEAVGDLSYPRLLRWRWLERALARFTLSRADQVVVLSANNREYAIRNGAREERTEFSGNWAMIDPVHHVDPAERAPYVDELGLGDRPFTVTVTRLERVKYPEDVLTVLAKARERQPELAGLLIGDGSIRGELEERARELGLDGHLFFVRGRDHLWVSQALAAASVVLAPMAGLTLTEAALAGAPIVTYDYEWHNEFIADGETGLVVPYRDTDAMAAAACALLEDPERAARLGDAARSAALQRMQGDGALAHERALAERLLSPSV